MIGRRTLVERCSRHLLQWQLRVHKISLRADAEIEGAETAEIETSTHAQDVLKRDLE